MDKANFWFVRKNKNGNLVPDHTKEQLDLHQS